VSEVQHAAAAIAAESFLGCWAQIGGEDTPGDEYSTATTGFATLMSVRGHAPGILDGRQPSRVTLPIPSPRAQLGQLLVQGRVVGIEIWGEYLMRR
jgi:hypothetical protein